MVENMDIIISGCQDHVIYKAGWCRRRIGVQIWIYVLIKGVRVDPCSVRSSGRFSVPSAARLFLDPRPSWNSANLLTSGSWLFLRHMFSVRKKTSKGETWIGMHQQSV